VGTFSGFLQNFLKSGKGQFALFREVPDKSGKCANQQEEMNCTRLFSKEFCKFTSFGVY
jgi:hypothetical protein